MFEPEASYYDSVERLAGYVKGGYHPTLLGDEFSKGRYQIVHKLGYGGSSTGV
jgi:serine/threonine-protein kinase SRPK3